MEPTPAFRSLAAIIVRCCLQKKKMILTDSSSPLFRPYRVVAGMRFVVVFCVAFIAFNDENRVCSADLSTVPPTPPVVSAASTEAEQSMAAMTLPDGWDRELFAAEPDVANIVAFDIDYLGRVYVCETFRQNRGVTDNRAHDEQWLLADLAAKTVQDRIDYHKKLLGDAAVTYGQQDDRIRRIRDTDGDGQADESIVFADGFNRIEEGTGAGVLVRGNQVYFTCIPKLWKLIDADGDGDADERVVMSDGYGVRVAFRGHDMHGLILGPDGRLYFSIGDRGYYVTRADGQVLSDPTTGAVFRCELDGSNLEVFAKGLRNPQELAFNDYGDLFSGDNNSDSGDKARIVQIVKGGDTGWRMYYQYLSDRGPFNREKIWHPYHEEQPAYIIPPIANLGDGPSGFAFDPGTGVDPTVRNKFFLCDFGGGVSNSGIRSFTLEADGAFYKLGDADKPIWNVMATDVAFGPDGSLWISDWVQGWDGVGKGRLYRVNGPEFDSTVANKVKALLRSDFSKKDTDELVGLLGHADRRVRNEVTWELANQENADALAAVATDSTQRPLARLHAIWGLEQIARKQKERTEAVTQAIASLSSLTADQDEYVRAVAAQVIGLHGDEQAARSLLTLLTDASARVRSQAAMGIAEAIKRKVNIDNAMIYCAALLAENDNKDPIVRHAGIMLMTSIGDLDAIDSLKMHANLSVRRAAVVALRRLESHRVANFLSDASPLVVLEAVRAIHDAPIPAALESLAKVLDDSSITDDAIIRRALNANYRIGSQANADAIAAYATRPVAPVAMRLEAIQMLDNWAEPDPRDRVLGDYRPIQPRNQTPAVDSLSKMLPAILKNADEVRDTAVSVAAKYGIAQVTPFLEQRVADRNLRPESRATSLRSLARLQPEKASEVALALLDVAQVKLRIAALQTLASLKPATAIEPLKKSTKSDSVIERQAAWDELAKIELPAAKEAIVQGLQDYLAGKIPADTMLNVIEAGGDWVDPSLLDQLSAHQSKLETENPLGKWWAALEGGDGIAGANVFNKTQLSCVRCHKVDRIGGEVGPVLTVIGKERDRRYLLESICLPDAAIAKGFETAVIADDSGQVYTGIIRAEDDDVVELIGADGVIQRIDQENIIGRKRGKSAMPEDLTKSMTMRELRDLVSYLASLQVNPRASDAKE
jgi:quinoprotein glucose dehydrogenase